MPYPPIIKFRGRLVLTAGKYVVGRMIFKTTDDNNVISIAPLRAVA